MVKILGDSSLVGVGQELRDSGIEELSDCDVVGLEEARGSGAEEFADCEVVLEELGDGDVVIGEELCHCDIVLLEEVTDGPVEELSDSDVVLGLGEEFGHRDVIVEEFCDGRVQVLGQSRVHKFGHSHIV